MLKSYYGSRNFIELSLPCSAGIVFSMFFSFDFGREAAGSRERRVWASKIVCFVTCSCWNVIMARGFFFYRAPMLGGERFCNAISSASISDRSRLRSKKVSKKEPKRLRNMED